MSGKNNTLFGYATVLFLVVVLGACAGMQTKQATPKITYKIAPEAKVTSFDYYLDPKCKIAKKPCLTYKMTVKNISSEPLRFISRITLPKEGKSVGGFIPRRGARDKVTKKRGPAVIQPGKEKAVEYPALYYEMPKEIEVEVTVMR